MHGLDIVVHAKNSCCRMPIVSQTAHVGLFAIFYYVEDLQNELCHFKQLYIVWTSVIEMNLDSRASTCSPPLPLPILHMCTYMHTVLALSNDVLLHYGGCIWI